MAELTSKDISSIINSLDIDDLKEQEPVEEIDPYSYAMEKLKAVSKRMRISNKIMENLEKNERVIEMDIPVVLERKSGGRELLKIFPAFWIEHSRILGDCKGNVNFTHGLTIEKSKLSALNSTLQNSLLQLPFGGAGGGVNVDKRILTPTETDRMAKNFANSLLKITGSNKDVMSAGTGCDERLMSIMYNSSKEIRKDAKKSFFLGKQMQDGGIRAKNSAVALGIFCIIKEALKGIEVQEIPGLQKHEDIIRKPQREISAVLIGFGAVEKELSYMMSSAGYKMLAISDSLGGIASKSGIYAEDAARWQRNHSSVAGMPKTIKVSNEQMMQINADVIIISSNVKIGKNLAEKIKTPLIIEMSPVLNPPVTEELSKKMMVVPYMVAGCVNAYADYLEFMQNIEDKFFDRKVIDSKIEDKAVELFKRVHSAARQQMSSLFDASYAIALQNLAKI